MRLHKFVSSCFVVGILLLLLSAVAIFTSHQGFASRLITFAFYLFILGAVLYLLELKKDEN